MSRKLGTLEPVIYFARSDGHLTLAPYSSFPTLPGTERRYAETLAEVDDLQRRLIEQERREWESDALYDEVVMQARRDAIRDRLYAKLTSSTTSEFDKDFIREYLKLRNERRDRHRQRFLERTMYLHAREFDTPGRRADEECFNHERIYVSRN